MHTVGILFPLAPGRAPSDPRATAFGRAALAARAWGVDVLVGVPGPHGAVGAAVRTVEGVAAWQPVRGARVHAWLHRFPDGDRPEAWTALLPHLGPAPVVNPPSLVVTCRDKLVSQRLLEAAGVAMPPVVDPHDGPIAREALDGWGAAFLKPRFGAFGRGVRLVRRGEALPDASGWVLQRAVPPPSGTSGVSVRVLVQRDVGGVWVVPTAAARVGHDDPVVNHARGAAVEPLDAHVGPDGQRAVHALAVAAADALAACPGGDDLGELGLDVVLDPDGRPHLIEVNAKPRGRLDALATHWPERFAAERDAAVVRPVRFAAWRAGLLHP
ncbi:MAG: hypothetical protein H6733_17790 [Alphaproteobacteria bacterium]|nr:hypothetical protein [Alphaproteobacteria bacterium]